jgi:hypothetical protein
MPVAGQDTKVAFKYYLWNSTLCESFHLPLHFAEIVCRNALHRGLTNRLTENWYNDGTFRTILDPRFLEELTSAYAQEAYQHRQNMTSHHLVSALSFGFWEHLATKRFERFLWAKGVSSNFPKRSSR